MWQQLLQRYAPLVDEDVSSLDRLDGVGQRTPGPVAAEHSQDATSTSVSSNA